jgi:hypothetical protein
MIPPIVPERDGRAAGMERATASGSSSGMRLIIAPVGSRSARRES